METNESQSRKTFCPEHAPILFDTPRQHVKASKNTYVQQCATIFELASKELEVKDYKRLQNKVPTDLKARLLLHHGHLQSSPKNEDTPKSEMSLQHM